MHCSCTRTDTRWDNRCSTKISKELARTIVYHSSSCPICWSCRIHRLHPWWGVRTPPNKCPGYGTKLSEGEVPVMLELWGMQNTSSMLSLSGPLRPGVVAPDRILSIGQIELKCVLMVNWITWNKTVLIFKQSTYAKLNCLKWNYFCMRNLIVWNWTVFDIETIITLNWFFLHLRVSKQNLY